MRGRGSVDEYLEQTAIANPHVTMHYIDPERATRQRLRRASTDKLPPEPKEIKPHPYGIELGMLVTMLQDAKATTLSQFLTSRRSPRQLRPWPARSARRPSSSTRANTSKIGRNEADKLYQAIMQTKIAPPATDCISPIGEELLLKGLHQVVPGEFYVAGTRPPAVYRGNPFQIEVGAGLRRHVDAPTACRWTCSTNCWARATPARCGSFLINTFDGLGSDAADKILKEAGIGTAHLARQAQAGRDRQAARGDAEREPRSGPDDERAALRQSRAAAISARRPAPSRRR